ncbi:MAG: hypothetical protein Q4B26_18570 [Eubacteriales bacterium]|nr:hypothetical protein [Eubacteriales bacterium]
MSRIKGILCLILLAVCVGIGVKCHQNEKFLDRNELHYDADDLFILADEETGLIGVYDGIKPVHYFYCKELFDSDLDSIPFLIINRKEDRHGQNR